MIHFAPSPLLCFQPGEKNIEKQLKNVLFLSLSMLTSPLLLLRSDCESQDEWSESGNALFKISAKFGPPSGPLSRDSSEMDCTMTTLKKSKDLKYYVCQKSPDCVRFKMGYLLQKIGKGLLNRIRFVIVRNHFSFFST